ncbi:hypothetical protein LNO89_11180 [Klebsiella pneumoniae subsp. pneumoniae]|nr:hypothetical protein [Klebsiella pneumoniae subsp. pneumoniae]
MKTIFDAETGELLGAHMVGAQVTEQIQGVWYRPSPGGHR